MNTLYLIGFPTFHSKSPILYNELYRINNLQYQYKTKNIKNTKQINNFIQYIINNNKESKNNKITGLSITSPLKGLVTKYIHYIYNPIVNRDTHNPINIIIKQIINTIYINQYNIMFGVNTDILGIRDMIINILPNVDNIYILGGSYTALSALLAIIALQYQGTITLYMRTVRNEYKVLQNLVKTPLIIKSWNNIDKLQNNSLIINTVPNKIFNSIQNILSIKSSVILNCVYLDIDKQFNNILIKNNNIIYNGYHLLYTQFTYQAQFLIPQTINIFPYKYLLSNNLLL